MHGITDENRFFNTIINFSSLAVFFATAALCVHFLLPADREYPFPTTIPVTYAEDETDEEITLNFQNYISEVSFNTNTTNAPKTDMGLTLYRQAMSKAAVEWFYTHITGDRDTAVAILENADKNNVPVSMAFALAYTESHYKTNAVHKNANNTIDRGLFQLNNNSFPKLTEEDFFDPEISAKYGLSHLKFCLETAGNDVAALAMYNAGTTRVRSNKTPQTTLNYIGNIIVYQKTLDDLFTQEVVAYYEPHLDPGINIAYAKTEK